MALTRVQATGKQQADNVTTFTLTFASPPTVGNAIVVAVSVWAFSSPTFSCADNRGNTYTLAVRLVGASGLPQAMVFVCANVATSAGPFTITITASSAAYCTGAAIEVGGLAGGTLVVDQTTTSTSGGVVSNPTTGTTAALTGSEVFVAAAISVDGGTQASITVQSVSPTWTQEAEELLSGHAVGECDSRVLTGVAGTTQSCAWTLAAGNPYVAVLAAFKVFVTPAASVRVSQDAIELLSLQAAGVPRVSQDVVELLTPQPPGAPRVSQTAVEVLASTAVIPPAASASASQLVVEILAASAPPPAAEVRVSQDVIELLAQSPPPPAAEARVSQAVIETLSPIPPATLYTTQVASELLQLQPGAPVATTQLAVELLQLVPAAGVYATQVASEILWSTPVQPLVVTQLACELIVIPRTVPKIACTVDFPTD